MKNLDMIDVAALILWVVMFIAICMAPEFGFSECLMSSVIIATGGVIFGSIFLGK